MAFLTLVVAALVCAPYLVEGASNPLPSVYIQIDFKFTWSEFCLMETYFKAKVANLVLQDNGKPINATQVYLNNFDEHCPAKNNVDKASLLFYIITPGGGFSDVDVELTKQAYEGIHYLVENKLGRMFGPVFQLKIDKVTAKGKDAPPKSDDFTEMERTYIAIGFAALVLLFIITMVIIVTLVKRRMKSNRNSEGNNTGEYIGEENRLHVIEDTSNANAPSYVNPGQPSGAETKF